jgi:hypothetical protein
MNFARERCCKETLAPLARVRGGFSMAVEVTDYHILFYGSPSGYQTNRAQIALFDDSNNTVAFIRFNDPGMFFENDYESGGIIRMHLPSAMFENVLDVLRNEKPIYIYFAAGRAFLATSLEPVGEEEFAPATT